MSSDANRTDLEPSAENGALTMERLEEFRQSFDANPSNRLMQNAVTQHDVNDIALNRSIVTEANHTFSTVLDDWGVTNQARTGRCWMFAGLNLFRAGTRNIMNVKQFEFSEPVPVSVQSFRVGQHPRAKESDGPFIMKADRQEPESVRDFFQHLRYCKKRTSPFCRKLAATIHHLIIPRRDPPAVERGLYPCRDADVRPVVSTIGYPFTMKIAL